MFFQPNETFLRGTLVLSRCSKTYSIGSVVFFCQSHLFQPLMRYADSVRFGSVFETLPFYPRDASAVLFQLAVALCLSITNWCSVKTDGQIEPVLALRFLRILSYTVSGYKKIRVSPKRNCTFLRNFVPELWTLQILRRHVNRCNSVVILLSTFSSTKVHGRSV